jgi:hypothetical protein
VVGQTVGGFLWGVSMGHGATVQQGVGHGNRPRERDDVERKYTGAAMTRRLFGVEGEALRGRGAAPGHDGAPGPARREGTVVWRAVHSELRRPEQRSSQQWPYRRTRGRVVRTRCNGWGLLL